MSTSEAEEDLSSRVTPNFYQSLQTEPSWWPDTSWCPPFSVAMTYTTATTAELPSNVSLTIQQTQGLESPSGTCFSEFI